MARRSKGGLPEAAISNKRTVNERVFCHFKHFRRLLAPYGLELTRFTAAVYRRNQHLLVMHPDRSNPSAYFNATEDLAIALSPA